MNIIVKCSLNGDRAFGIRARRLCPRKHGTQWPLLNLKMSLLSHCLPWFHLISMFLNVLFSLARLERFILFILERNHEIFGISALKWVVYLITMVKSTIFPSGMQWSRNTKWHEMEILSLLYYKTRKGVKSSDFREKLWVISHFCTMSGLLYYNASYFKSSSHILFLK